MKVRFLWIEDGAFSELSTLLAPLYINGNYDPVVALDITDGVSKLNQGVFDAVIVDIRVPPGNDPGWRRLYSERGRNGASERLGVRLLSALFNPRADDHKLVRKPSWLTSGKVGVLAVDNKIERDSEDTQTLREQLKALDIRFYKQKTALTDKNLLRQMVDEITGSSG